MAGTQVTQTQAFKVGSVQRGTLLQLLLCHCFIFTVAIIFGANTLSILCACLLSFLLMLNIPYNLYLLEIALDRLARSLPVEPISLRLRWPLTGLFVRFNNLRQQSGLQVQMEQRNVAYRDQLLQQVGKTAAQEERNRLARDLHDSIKQQLFSIVVSAAAVKARWQHNPDSARKVVDDIECTAQEAQVEMQALLQQLRPTALENVGLIESLRVQSQALGYRTGAEVTTELGDLPPDELLPIGAQEMIFRIVQEGFANIARHARASHVWLSLRRQRDALLVEIGDDGQGFDLAHAHERPHTYDGMGLPNVRERVAALGGTVAIWSLPGKGTTLHLCIPLVQPHAQEQERANQELATTVRKTRLILRVGIWAAELAAVLVLLYTPVFIALWAVLTCIIVALASWLLAQQYRLQVSLQFGRGHPQNIALLAESYGLLSGTLLLGMLYANYFNSWHSSFDFASIPDMFVTNNAWLLSGIFIMAIVTTYMLYSRHTDRYYKTLSGKSLREQLRQQFQQVVIDWMAWAVALGLTVFLLGFFKAIQKEPPVQGTGLIFLCAWFIIILLKSIRTVRWHNVLRVPAQRATQEQKGESV
jgi:signal transduction histidine kinase